MRIVLALLLVGGLLVLEAWRHWRRERQLPYVDSVVVKLTIDTSRFAEGIRRIGAAMARMELSAETAAVGVGNFQAVLLRGIDMEMERMRQMQIRAATSISEVVWVLGHREWPGHDTRTMPVGEPEVVPVDVDHCWRCQVTQVSREDDLGLCSGCAKYLRTL